MEPYAAVARQHAGFEAHARGESECLADWAAAVVGDPEVEGWLAGLPPLKQQPNLVFAAARWHGVPAPGPYDAFRDALLGDDGTIRCTILERSTQTNEVGRLASLTPVLARIPGPLALLELGASAGLCLYPDRYDYAWDGAGSLAGSGGPTLRCRVDGPLPVPTRHPEVGWRGGVDLNPLDVDDADAMAWLTTLVWPEQDDRRERLRQAIAIARADPPHLERGDLLTELPRLVDEAAQHGTVVVFHSAVIAYLAPADRAAYTRLVRGLVTDGACHWVSNEGRNVLPDVTASGPALPDELATFVLGLDGRAVAWTHGHGASMTWFG